MQCPENYKLLRCPQSSHLRRAVSSELVEDFSVRNCRHSIVSVCNFCKYGIFYEFTPLCTGMALKGKDCLLNEKIISLGKETSKQQHQEKIYTFVSHNMKMYSVEQSKIALSWKDDKRIPMSHNKHLTYALGHYKTK